MWLQDLCACLSEQTIDQNALKQILENNSSFNLDTPIKTTSREDTLLNLVCGQINEYELVALLLKHGAKANIPGLLGMTPLHNAQNLDTITLLKANGGLLNVRDNDGNLPLHNVILSAPNAVEYIKALIGDEVTIDTPIAKNIKHNTLLSKAVSNSNYVLAQQLVNELHATIKPDIWYAISTYQGDKNNAVEFMKFLLAHKVPYNIHDIHSQKPGLKVFLEEALQNIEVVLLEEEAVLIPAPIATTATAPMVVTGNTGDTDNNDPVLLAYDS